MAFEVGAIVSKLQLRKDQWDQSIKKVKTDQQSLSGLVAKNSQQFKKMGRSMTIAGGVVVGGVGLMVKAFADFDQAMTESLAIMGDISAEMRAEMAETARTISTETTFSAKELAAAYFYLASAGFDAEQSVMALGEVARFAQAGAFDLSTATDLLTDAQTAMGLSSKDAAKNQKELVRVSDILVGANTLANASVQQFAEALVNKAAPALVNVNKGMEEGVATLAAFADRGIKGRKAGMQLAMMLNAIDIAARRNKKEWEALGLTLFDAEGEMLEMGELIGSLEVALGDMTPEMRGAALETLGFTAETKNSILTLMGSSEKITLWTEKLKEMGGITETVSKKQLETFNAQLKILRNVVTNAAISLGETLAPSIQDLIVDFKEIILKVTDWIKENPKLTGTIIKMVAKIGALMLVLGPLVIALPTLVKSVGLLKIAMKGALGPVGLLITALGIIAIRTNAAKGAFNRMSEAVQMEARASGEKVSWFKKTIVGLNEALNRFTPGLDATKMAQAAMNKKIDEARESLKAYKPLVDKVAKGFKDWFSNLMPLKKGLSSTSLTAEDLFKQFSEGKITFEEYLKKLEELKAGHDDKLNPALKTTIELLEYTITPAMELYRQFAEGKISAIELAAGLQDLRAEAERIADPLKNIAMIEGDIKLETDKMTDGYNVLKAAGVPALFHDQLTAIEKLKQGTIEATNEIVIQFASVTERFIGLALDMGDAFGNFADGLMDKGSTVGENLRGLWTDIGDSFKTLVSDYIRDEMSKLFLSIVGKTTEMAAGVTSGISSIGPAITGIATGIGTLITTLATAIATAAETLAAAAPALMVVLGIALAAYAGFKLISSLFGKKGKDGSLGGIEQLLRDISWIQLNAINLKLDGVNDYLAGMFPKFDSMLDQFYKIRDATEKIRDNTKGTLSALTAKGTVYVDVFRSAVMGDLGNKFESGLSGLGTSIVGGLDRVGTKIAGIDFDAGGIIKAIKGKATGPPAFASGFEGIVTHPIRPLIAEEGPEYLKVQPLSGGREMGLPGTGRQEVHVHIKPLVFPRGDKYIVDFVIEDIKHGRKIPIEAVGG